MMIPNVDTKALCVICSVVCRESRYSYEYKVRYSFLSVVNVKAIRAPLLPAPSSPPLLS